MNLFFLAKWAWKLSENGDANLKKLVRAASFLPWKKVWYESLEAKASPIWKDIYMQRIGCYLAVYFETREQKLLDFNERISVSAQRHPFSVS